MLRMYVKEGCPDCARARGILNAHGLTFEEVFINSHYSGLGLPMLGWKGKVPFLVFTTEEPSHTRLSVLSKMISLIGAL